MLCVRGVSLFVALGLWGGCLPTPSDWSGGWEGIYQGDVTEELTYRPSTGPTTTTKVTSLSVYELVASDSPLGTHLLEMGPCAGLPLRSTPVGLMIAKPLPSCTESRTGSTTQRDDYEYEVTDATVKGLSPNGDVTIHLEYTSTHKHTPSSGAPTSDVASAVIDFTGKRL